MSTATQRTTGLLVLTAFLLVPALSGQTETFEQATERFGRAAKEAKGRLRIKAHNSYGVFLLRHGDAGRAAEIFGAIEKDVRESGELDEIARSRFLYNYGTALERSGRTEQAITAYQESLRRDPGFKPACDAAFELARKSSSPEESVRRLTSLVEQLIDQRDFETVAQYLRATLAGSGSETAYPEQLVLLVRYLAAARVGPPEFRKEWMPLLSESWPFGSAEEWVHRGSIGERRSPGRAGEWQQGLAGERAEQIETAYSGEFPLLLAPEEGRAFTSSWQTSRQTAEAYSALLQRIGDWYLQEGDPRSALTRYALAWSSAENAEAAVSLANLLWGSRATIDPQGTAFDRLLAVLFDGKGEAYLHDDWGNVLRFHIALAQIFERQERWGSSADPRSAIFQWEHALRAQQRLREDSSGREEAAPGLHARLALAYRSAGRGSEAVSEYLNAAEQYVALKRPEAAETLLLQVERFDPGLLQGNEQQRLEGVRGAVAHNKEVSRRSSAFGEDDAITAMIQSKLLADPEIERGSVEVTTTEGIVRVSGNVKRTEKLGDIERVVRSTEGVRQVVTEIEIAGPPR